MSDMPMTLRPAAPRGQAAQPSPTDWLTSRPKRGDNPARTTTKGTHTMKTLASILLLASITLLSACGDPDDGKITLPPDARVGGLPDARVNTTPDASTAQTDCDTVTQNCEGDADKCTLVVDGQDLDRVCLAETGMVGEGMTCLRTTQGNAGVGHDNCAAGLWCSGLGFGTGADGFPVERACRRWCRNTMGCDQPQRCVELGDLVPQDAFCLTTCELWGTTCGAGLGCNIITTTELESVGYCTSVGTVILGGECDGEMLRCGADAVCISGASDTDPSSCRAACDQASGATGTHGCETGYTCSPLNGAPTGYGVCVM